ncbi:MAG: ABC transporter permease [Lachnospiraceae bacterium]|nr:ABC transporter permease [Lachnospiraceae bacterium]MBQ9123378.1 ABC transporter permease [Lachnospiraceae bacterium]
MEKKKEIQFKFDVRWLLKAAPSIGLVLLVLFFAIMSDGRSVSTVNLKILMNQVIFTALISIGGIFAFSMGAIDMSMSGSVCCVAIAAALAGVATNSLWIMLFVCVITSLTLGVLKAVLEAYLQVPVFMVTIVLGMALSSLGNVLLGTQSNLSVAPLVGSGQKTSLYIVILAVFYLFAMFLFNYTKFGKSLRILGGNPATAQQVGIRIRNVKLKAYLMGAASICLTAIVILLRSKSVNSSTASSLGMDMMVAIVLGGMPLSGGAKSKIAASLIGAAIITVLNNGLMVIGVDSGMIQLVRGVLFLIVVFITGFSYRTNLLTR